jgi:hypothetical protein
VTRNVLFIEKEGFHSILEEARLQERFDCAVMSTKGWATRDLLKSLGWGIRALHQLGTATMVPSPRRLPHTISPLAGDGFEPSPSPVDSSFSAGLRPSGAVKWTP